MRHLRATARLGAVAALSVTMIAILVGVDTLLRLRGAGPAAGGARARWQAGWFQCWARLAARTIGMRMEVHGPAPRPPFLLVSNHVGYVDIVLLAAHLRCAFVAKSEVRGWPVLGRLCRTVGTVFIDRSNRRDIPRVAREVERILGSGRGVVLFPEGTSSSGETVLPFRASLLAEAARASRPVCYAAVSYRTDPRDEPAERSVCWWGDMEFPGHFFRLLGLRGFEARLRFGAAGIREDDRKRLAERLHEAVAGELRATV